MWKQKIKTVLDLGYQPLADDLKDFNSKNNGTNFFPIVIGFVKNVSCYKIITLMIKIFILKIIITDQE